MSNLLCELIALFLEKHLLAGGSLYKQLIHELMSTSECLTPVIQSSFMLSRLHKLIPQVDKLILQVAHLCGEMILCWLWDTRSHYRLLAFTDFLSIV